MFCFHKISSTRVSKSEVSYSEIHWLGGFLCQIDVQKREKKTSYKRK